MEDKPVEKTPRIARLSRRFIIAVTAAQTAYWIYTFRLIAVNANPMGDGMEFAAIVPFGLVFIALVAPPLLLADGDACFPLVCFSRSLASSRMGYYFLRSRANLRAAELALEALSA